MIAVDYIYIYIKLYGHIDIPERVGLKLKVT